MSQSSKILCECWKLSNEFSWPNLNMRNSIYRKPLNSELFCKCQTLYEYYKLRKALKLYERSKTWSLKRTGTSYDQKLVHTDNLWQNICNNVKKSSKTGQAQNTLITASAEILTPVTKVLFQEGMLGTRFYLNPILSFS